MMVGIANLPVAGQVTHHLSPSCGPLYSKMYGIVQRSVMVQHKRALVLNDISGLLCRQGPRAAELFKLELPDTVIVTSS